MISTRCYDFKTSNAGKLPTVDFNRICSEVFSEIGLAGEDAHVNRKTILSRISRGNLTVNRQQNKETPLLEIEPILLQFATWKQEAGQPITPTEGLHLANSLISGTAIEQKLKAFQRSIKDTPTGTVSVKFWKQFCKRNSNLLDVNRGYRVANNRTEWVTHLNINHMYDMVYDQMVAAGVARHLPAEDFYYINEAVSYTHLTLPKKRIV